MGPPQRRNKPPPLFLFEGRKLPPAYNVKKSLPSRVRRRKSGSKQGGAYWCFTNETNNSCVRATGRKEAQRTPPRWWGVISEKNYIRVLAACTTMGAPKKTPPTWGGGGRNTTPRQLLAKLFFYYSPPHHDVEGECNHTSTKSGPTIVPPTAVKG